MPLGMKFRIYPNKMQKNLIDHTFGCSRLIYNRGLELRKKSYDDGNPIGYSETSKMLTELKKSDEYSFLKDVDSIALQQALRDLDKAYKSFFKKQSSFPVFKSKRSAKQSYRTQYQKNNITIVGKYIKLPKLGYVKIKQSREICGKINNVTVERTLTDKYFVVLNVEQNYISNVSSDKSVGIDVGLKDFYTDSNAHKVSNERFLSKDFKKLVREQRKLSRMIECNICDYKVVGNKRYPIYRKPLDECKNIQKQRIQVAKVHERIANKRNDFLHKESTKLINDNQVICIEDLNVKGLLKNHKLARSISDVSWGSFYSMLEYKAIRNNRIVVKVPRFYPSSQICSCCGNRDKRLKDLKIRKWTCEKCHSVHDRDVNAAINILNKGLEMLAS